MAILSLLALILAVVLGSITKINIGILAIALASALGLSVGGLAISQLISDFPSSLFLTLLGITLLFGHAQHNGTLERITRGITRLLRGSPFWAPIGFFLLAVVLSAVGAGNIAAAALIAPAAMAAAQKLRISPFLMSIMVANGANAGGLSPIAPTGIIAAERMAQVGLTGLSWHIFLNSFIAHVIVAFGGYFLFGGYRLLVSPERKLPASDVPQEEKLKFERDHWITLAVIGALLVGVVVFGLDLIVGTFAGVVLLSLLPSSDERKAFLKVPWGVIVMVCGVSMLTTLMDKTGGLDLFTTYVARFSNEYTVTAVIAFAAALMSVYSSSSGVVLPTFLLLIPSLTGKIAGSDAAVIASAICVSSHLVDVSPLSTIGALCLASVPDGKDQRALFNKMLAWGLSMTVVGALVGYLFSLWG